MNSTVSNATVCEKVDLVRTRTQCRPSSQCNHQFFQSCYTDFGPVYDVCWWLCLCFALLCCYRAFKSLIIRINIGRENKLARRGNDERHKISLIILTLCCGSTITTLLNLAQSFETMYATDSLFPIDAQTILIAVLGTVLHILESLILILVWRDTLEGIEKNRIKRTAEDVKRIINRVTVAATLFLLLVLPMTVILIIFPKYHDTAFSIINIIAFAYLGPIAVLGLWYALKIIKLSKKSLITNAKAQSKIKEFQFFLYGNFTAAGTYYVCAWIYGGLTDIDDKASIVKYWTPTYQLIYYILTVILTEVQTISGVFSVCEDFKATVHRYLLGAHETTPLLNKNHINDQVSSTGDSTAVVSKSKTITLTNPSHKARISSDVSDGVNAAPDENVSRGSPNDISTSPATKSKTAGKATSKSKKQVTPVSNDQ